MATSMDHLLSPLKRGTKDYLMKTIVPTLVQGLIQMAIQRPEDPHKWLSEFLLEKSPNGEEYEIVRKGAAGAVHEAPSPSPAPAQRQREPEPEPATAPAASPTPQRHSAAEEKRGDADEGKAEASESKSGGAGAADRKEVEEASHGRPRSAAGGVKISGRFVTLTIEKASSGGGSVLTCFDVRTRDESKLTLNASQTASLNPAVFDSSSHGYADAFHELSKRVSLQGGSGKLDLRFQ